MWSNEQANKFAAYATVLNQSILCGDGIETAQFRLTLVDWRLVIIGEVLGEIGPHLGGKRGTVQIIPRIYQPHSRSLAKSRPEIKAEVRGRRQLSGVMVARAAQRHLRRRSTPLLVFELAPVHSYSLVELLNRRRNREPVRALRCHQADTVHHEFVAPRFATENGVVFQH